MYVEFKPRGFPARVNEDILDSFDEAMKDTLDAGKPGPAETLSRQRLEEAYRDWKPRPIEGLPPYPDDDDDPQDGRHGYMPKAGRLYYR